MNRRKFLKNVGKVLGYGALSVGVGTLVEPYIEDALTTSKLEEELQKKYLIQVFGGKYTLIITGDTSEKNILQLAGAIDDCEKWWDTFEEQMKNVKRIDLKSKAGLLWEEIFGFSAMAIPILDTIYLGGYFIDSPKLIHELAHIQHYNLKHPFDFMKEWQEISQIEYGSLVKETEQGFIVWKEPRGNKGYEYLADHGFMSPYGGLHVWEDIAEFQARLFYGMEVLKTSDSLEDYQTSIRNGVFATDPREDDRYIRKLELLLRENFISPGEFELLEPIFVR